MSTAGVTYLEFTFLVCFFRVVGTRFPNFTFTFIQKGTFSPRDLQLCSVTLTSQDDLRMIKTNHHAIYLRQRFISFESYRADTQTHTQ